MDMKKQSMQLGLPVLALFLALPDTGQAQTDPARCEAAWAAYRELLARSVMDASQYPLTAEAAEVRTACGRDALPAPPGADVYHPRARGPNVPPDTTPPDQTPTDPAPADPALPASGVPGPIGPATSTAGTTPPGSTPTDPTLPGSARPGTIGPATSAAGTGTAGAGTSGTGTSGTGTTGTSAPGIGVPARIGAGR